MPCEVLEAETEELEEDGADVRELDDETELLETELLEMEELLEKGREIEMLILLDEDDGRLLLDDMEELDTDTDEETTVDEDTDTEEETMLDDETETDEETIVEELTLTVATVSIIYSGLRGLHTTLTLSKMVEVGAVQVAGIHDVCVSGRTVIANIGPKID